METITLEDDIIVFYITATSFPDGIMDAHEKLHALEPVTKERRFFGISRPEHGQIIYRAAAEELFPGEAETMNLPAMVIKKGNYTTTMVHDYTKDKQSIARAFQQLLNQPGIDPQGYCIEWYKDDENNVQCMVKLAG